MKKTLFLSAILGAILAVPAMAVTYGGTIYTYTPGNDAYLHSGTFTKTTIDSEGNFVVGTETTGWANAASGDRINTLRFVAGGSQDTAVIQFNNLTLGGIVVEESSAVKSIVNENNRNFYIGSTGTATTGSTINDDFLIKTTWGSVNLRGIQEIAIADGKALTLQGSSGINITGNVTVSGAGTLKLNSATTLSKTLTNNGKIAGADSGTVITISNDIEGFTHTYSSELSEGANGYRTSADVTVMTGTGTTEGITFKYNNQAITLSNGHFTAALTGGKYFINEGTVTHSASNGATAYEMAANTKLVFAENANTTLAINTTGADNSTRSITVNAGANVTVASINNSWGLKEIDVEGSLRVTGELKLAYNHGTASANNRVLGAGSLTAGTLTAGNWGHYLVDVNSLTATTLNVSPSTELTLNSATSNISTANVQNSSTLTIGSASASIATMNVNGSSTLNLLGASTSITTKLYANGKAVINIGDATHNAVVIAKRLELGDVQGSGNTSTLNLAAGSVLKVTDSDYTGEKPYKNNPIVFGEWEAETTANIAGKFIAAGASIQPGDKGFTLNIAETGIVAVKGIGTWGCQKADATQKQAINLNGGLLVLGENGLNGEHNSSLTLNLNGGTLASTQEAPTIAVNATLGEGTTTTLSSTAYTVDAETNSVTAGTTASNLTVSGVISGAGALKVAGTGIVTLSGTNTYTGGTTVASGTLKLTDGGQTGLIKGVVTVKNGATLDLAGNDSLGWDTNNVTALNIEQGGKLFVSAAGQRPGQNVGSMYNQTFQKMAITLTGATISGNEGATIDLFNNNNVAGNYTTLTVNAADGATAANPTVSTVDSKVTLKLRQNSTTITVAENAALVIANGLKKNGGTPILVKAGAGSLTLGAASDYTGGTTISEGTVVMGNAAALGTGAVSIASGATLDVNNNAIANAITTAGNIVNNGGSGMYSLTTGLQNVTLSGNAVIGGAKAISMVKNGGTDTAALAMGGHTLTVSNTKGLYMNKTNVTGGGAIDVTKGEIVFFGSVAADNTKLNLNDDTKLMINADSSIGGLTGSGSIGVAVANDSTGAKNDSTLTINTASGSSTSSATINGDNHLTIKKTGAGEQVFTGALNNVKSIVVAEGDLTVTTASTIKQLGGLGTVKALADLTVTEAEEGKVTLGGMEIAGNTTVTVNDHAGTLKLKNLTVKGAGSTINANLDLSGATVTLNGNSVTLGCELKFSGTTITLSDADIAIISNEEGAGLVIFSDVELLTLGTTTYTTDYIGLVEDSGLILTATSTLPENVFVNFNATDKTVSLSVVPEPATATLSLLALAALAARRKRK